MSSNTPRHLDIPIVNIDEEFQNLIPVMSTEEREELERSIVADGGCRDKLVVWEQGDILLDGHNRYRICQEHGFEFDVIRKSFADRDEAKCWIIANQLGRRNLTPMQASELRGIWYNLEKRAVDEFRGNQYIAGDQNEHKQNTAEKIANQTGVSPATVRRDGQLAEALENLSPEERAEILSGRSKKTKSEIINPKKEEGGEEKPRTLGPPCIGMQYARLAILNLKEIREDDIEREQAFAFVKGWIADHE